MAIREPWLSVVMPTYNGAAHLAAALESVRREGAEGLEVIAVDDGSTDDTLGILGAYQGVLPLRVVRRGRTGNWVAGSNLGLAEAVGRHACFLHQDDLWLPGRLEALRAEARRQPPPALVVHPALFVGPGGERLGTWRCPLPHRDGPVDPDLLVERLLVQNFIAMPSPMFDRAAALRLGGMDETLWFTADWDLWLRLARSGPVRYLRRPLAAFRLHPSSQTLARESDSDSRRHQLRVVLERAIAGWAGDPEAVPRVRGAAEFSVEVNVALAGAVRGEPIPWRALLRRWLELGPGGWRRYWRDSRILERVAARLRLRWRLARAEES